MKKIINTFSFLLIPLISFAQQERPEREGRFPSSGGAEDLADSFGGPGTNTAAVDNYTVLLLFVAVSMIVFFVYKKFQSKQA